MNIFIQIFLLALLLQPLWVCWSLCTWLHRHRHASAPKYRNRSRLAKDATLTVKPHPRAKPEWLRQRIMYLATHLDSCRAITHAFNRSTAEASVGKSWVAEFVKCNAAEIALRRRSMRRHLPTYFAVNHTWALDLTFVPSPSGLTFTVLGIIDQGSRHVLCLKALPGKCSWMLLGHLFLAFSRYGLPSAIRTDNESMFTSQLWCGTLKALAIAHRRGPPCQPWRNGRIERLVGTLKPLLRKIKQALSEH
jgi:transposase InsO family protein